MVLTRGVTFNCVGALAFVRVWLLQAVPVVSALVLVFHIQTLAQQFTPMFGDTQALVQILQYFGGEALRLQLSAENTSTKIPVSEGGHVFGECSVGRLTKRWTSN